MGHPERFWRGTQAQNRVSDFPLVSATLRELKASGSINAHKRLPSSTAPAATPAVGEEAGTHTQELRRELRTSDRALSDLRTELWQAQERCRRLATEVWRMDGERTRLRAVQGQLGAELGSALGALRLRPTTDEILFDEAGPFFSSGKVTCQH